MNDEITAAIWELLTGEKARPLTKPGVIRGVWDITGANTPTQVGNALGELVASGELVAVQGSDIPWAIPNKRAGTYYLGVAVWQRELKEIADAKAAKLRQRLEERAADEADLAMRSLHPVEWRRLFEQKLRELAGK